MKEINVIGTMQLLAACQKAPSVQRLVRQVLDHGVRLRNRDPAMFTEDMEPRRAAALRLRQGRRRGRGLRARVRPPPPRRRGDARCGSPTSSAPTSTARSRPTSGCRCCRPSSASTPACSSCTRRTSWTCSSTPSGTDQPGTFNIAGDGVLMLSQALRRLSAPRCPCPASRSAASASVLRQCPVGGLLPGADQLPHLRPRGGHHPDARAARLRARVHDRRGVRRLRRRADAHRRPDRAGPRPRRSTGCRRSTSRRPSTPWEVAPDG